MPQKAAWRPCTSLWPGSTVSRRPHSCPEFVVSSLKDVTLGTRLCQVVGSEGLAHNRSASIGPPHGFGNTSPVIQNSIVEDQNRSCLDCRSIRSHSVLQIVSQKAAKFGNKERVNVFFVRLVNRLDVSSGGRLLVRTAGLEPARGYPQRILSPLRLPVPPRPRGCGSSTTSLGFESTERKLHPPCGLKTLARLKPNTVHLAVCWQFVNQGLSPSLSLIRCKEGSYGAQCRQVAGGKPDHGLRQFRRGCKDFPDQHGSRDPLCGGSRLDTRA